RTLAEAEAASSRLAVAEARATGGLLPSPGRAISPHEPRPRARIDSFPYSHLVHEVISTPPRLADASASLREGVAIVLDRNVSSVFVQNNAGELGIATERDLLRAINKDGETGLDTPLAAIMSKPLHTIPEDAFVYRAIGRLERMGFRLLGV